MMLCKACDLLNPSLEVLTSKITCVDHKKSPPNEKNDSVLSKKGILRISFANKTKEKLCVVRGKFVS